MKRTCHLILLLTMLFCMISCDSEAYQADPSRETTEGTESIQAFYDETERDLPISEELQVTVSLHLSCRPNVLFNKYDLSVLLDGEEIAILEHGTDETIQVRISDGSHTLRFNNADNPDINGEIDFSADTEKELYYMLNCKRDRVEIEIPAPETAAHETAATETAAHETAATETAATETAATETAATDYENQPSKQGSGSSGVTIPDHEETEGHLVWVPVKGGKKYHISSTCSGMEDPMQVSVETASENGYTPCKRCCG